MAARGLLILAFFLLTGLIAILTLDQDGVTLGVRAAPPAHVDAVVLTHESFTGPGLDLATRIYREGRASRVLVSDVGLAGPPTAEEATVLPVVRELIDNGVPAPAIVTLDTTLEDEPAALRDLFAAEGWRRALVVLPERSAAAALTRLRQEFAGSGVELGAATY